jgi:hypothetical protein
LFGAERPLDDALKAKPYLASDFGLFTGSIVRWYVEGDTEYHAILHVLPEPSRIGVELVNLSGAIESGRDNAALKLRVSLVNDTALRRFSMISFDLDVSANVRAIRQLVDENLVVGYIAPHRPDFELANFTVTELAEIAARMDESMGISGDAVRGAYWAGITNARAFEARYLQVSARKPGSLKGGEWGRALAEFAVEFPNRSDDGSERPFWKEIRAALTGRIANYDLQKEHTRFDRETFEQINIERSTSIAAGSS